MADDPVCHIAPEQPDLTPPPRPLPSIPIATDLNSALAAINAMRQIIDQLTLPKPEGGDGGLNGDWKEKSRVEKVERVYNPNDREQWVDVKRVNRLVLEDNVTQKTWVWNRQRQ